MSGVKVIGKALKLSLQTKTAWTIFVSILGFGMAFFPTLIAHRLERLTNLLQQLPANADLLSAALGAFAVVVILFVVQAVFDYVQSLAYSDDWNRTGRYIKKHLLYLKCRVKYRYIENDDDFLSKLVFAEDSGGSQQAAASMQNLISLAQQAITFVSITLALWAVNPWIVVCILVTSIPAIILSYLQKDETFRARIKWMNEGKQVIDYLILCGADVAIQEIRHNNLFDYLKAKWRTCADDYVGKKNKLVAKHVRYNLAADFLRSVVYVVVLLVTAYEIYQNPTLGLGAFTLVFTLSSKMQGVTASLFAGVMQFVGDVPFMRAYFQLDDVPKEPLASKQEPLASPEIQFDDVSFAYPGTDQDVLKHISVTIQPGEKVAIVGENGSGKSTFVNLLCGMFEPGRGTVYVGGKPIAEHLSQVRDSISVVFQDFGRYETSIRDNITVSNRDRHGSDAEILEAAEKVNALDVIEEQPKGLDETLGVYNENSRTLSGGQWQKLALLRAAYRNQASIMILDEPTAALDPIAETELYRDFAGITEEKTTILISHRLGISSVVDRILVFHDGEIIEDGSHHELMERNGHYAALYRAQAKWYQD